MPLGQSLDERWSMPILIMALSALAVALVLGGLLFVAGISERRQPSATPEKPIYSKKPA